MGTKLRKEKGGGEPTRRQRPAVLVIKFDHLIDDHAKLFEDFAFVVAMTSAQKQSRGAAHVAGIFIGPLDDLDVTCAFFHD